MGIQENWLANLRRLVDEEGKGDRRLGFRVVADRSGLSEEYVYQLVEGKPRADGLPREVGKLAAKKIARAYADERGGETWFDQAPGSAVDSATEPSDLVIHQYAAAGAMGRGLVLESQPPGIIRSWRVDPVWLRLNVPHHTGIQNLRIVTGFGSSMRGMFNPGDPLLCDCGVKKVDVDGAYFFRIDDHGFIKIIQRVPGPDGIILRAKSKNPDYDPFDITPQMQAAETFEVFGRILTVWKSEQL